MDPEACPSCLRKRGVLMAVHARRHKVTGVWVYQRRCAAWRECWAYRCEKAERGRERARDRARKPADLPLKPLYKREGGRCQWCGEAIYRKNQACRIVVDRRRMWHEGRTIDVRAEPEPRCVQEYNAQAFTFRGAIFVRDRGVCASCGRDCLAEQEAWESIRPSRDGVYEGDDWREQHDAWEREHHLWVAQQPMGWHADHVVPLEDGGEHLLSNGQTLCAQCHASKTAQENVERAARRRGVLDTEQRELADGEHSGTGHAAVGGLQRTLARTAAREAADEGAVRPVRAADP